MMHERQRLLTAAAGSLIACAAIAQVGPTCCKYVGIWPAEGNPDGACAGSSSRVCTTGSNAAGVNDPMARRFGPLFTPNCYDITLTGTATFVHQDCALPPPAGALFLVSVQLSDGQCCYIVGDAQDVTLTATPQPFQIPSCSGACASSPPGNN